MMILCSEILKFISLSNELVSLSLVVTWQFLLKVNMNLSQEKIVETRPTEAEIWSRIFSKENIDWTFFFLVQKEKEWNNY